MSENADWNAPVELEPEMLDGLAAGLRTLAEEAGDFEFQAIWAGDAPETSATVELHELLKDNNEIKNRHVYKVTSHRGAEP